MVKVRHLDLKLACTMVCKSIETLRLFYDRNTLRRSPAPNQPSPRHSRHAALLAAEEKAAKELPFKPQLWQPHKPLMAHHEVGERKLQSLSDPRTGHWQKCKLRTAFCDAVGCVVPHKLASMRAAWHRLQ